MELKEILMLVALISYVVCSFLLGSVFFCKVVCKLIKGVDIVKESDDHNPGAFNAIEKCGVKVGMFGLLLDAVKGALPVYAFIQIFPNYTNTFWMLLVMVAPVLGHAVGIFNHFKGGKCIATSFGVLIGATPLSYLLFILAGLYIISCCFRKVRDKIKSIATYSIFAIISFGLIFDQKELIYIHIAGCVIGIIAVVKHLMNKNDDHLYTKDGKKIEEHKEEIKQES